MEIILLQRIEKLGQMGDVVRVKDGFARNFLLPKGKALRATEANRARFEQQRTTLEARNLDERKEAEAVAGRMGVLRCVLLRQASDLGQLYGSVSARDIADALAENEVKIGRGQVVLDRPIKTLGVHKLRISLHPEVSVGVEVNVARSAEEAKLQEEAPAVIFAQPQPVEAAAEANDSARAGAEA